MTKMVSMGASVVDGCRPGVPMRTGPQANLRLGPAAQVAPLVEGLALAEGGDGGGVDVEVVGRVRAPDVRVAVEPAAGVARAEVDQAVNVVLVEQQERQQLAA